MLFHPSYHVAGASPLPLVVRYIFLVGSNILLSTVLQQQVVSSCRRRWMHVLLFHHLKCWESIHSYVYTWINVGKNVEKREPIYFWWECKLAQETSNCQHLLDRQKSQRVSKKHLFLLYRLCQSLYVDHNKLWKILKEMGISDHLTCLLRNLYAGKKSNS